MRKVMFCKQYVLWLPRWWFLLLILILATMLVVLGVRNIAYYLAISKPEQGQYLIVEGWLDDKSLDDALATYHRNENYQFIITTGGPDKSCGGDKLISYAEKSAKYLIDRGLAPNEVVVIPTPESAQNRTFLSAVMVRDWFAYKNIRHEGFDIFTGNIHARRTHLLYKKAFASSIRIGLFASGPSRFQLSSWWKTSYGAKMVITEFVALIWTVLFFDPGEVGSHQEKWGVTKHHKLS